jgi:hypothetical protein
MTDREEETTKFAKYAKKDAKIVFSERYKQCNNSARLKVDRLKEKTCAIEIALHVSPKLQTCDILPIIRSNFI